jgi:hypothetical protein
VTPDANALGSASCVPFCQLLIAFWCEGQTQESYTTTMKHDLLKQNESSLGIMKRDRKHESKLLSMDLSCSNRTLLECGHHESFILRGRLNGCDIDD